MIFFPEYFFFFMREKIIFKVHFGQESKKGQAINPQLCRLFQYKSSIHKLLVPLQSKGHVKALSAQIKRGADWGGEEGAVPGESIQPESKGSGLS